jgi:hypothetical protein
MAISKEQREFEIYDEFFTVREDDESIKEVHTPKFQNKLMMIYLKQSLHNNS